MSPSPDSFALASYDAASACAACRRGRRQFLLGMARKNSESVVCQRESVTSLSQNGPSSPGRTRQIRQKRYLTIVVVMLMFILTPDCEHRDVSDSGSRECPSRPPRLPAGGRRLPAVPASAGTAAIRNCVALADIAASPGGWGAAAAPAWRLPGTACLATARRL